MGSVCQLGNSSMSGGRPLTNTAKAALFAQSTKETFILLLTISHPDWTDDVRVSSDPTQILPVNGPLRGTISNGDEYIFVPFTINLPAQDDTGIAKATIVVDNTDRRIVDQIRSASSAVTVGIQIVLASNPDVVEVSYADFKMERATYDALIVTGEISVEYFDLEPYGSKRFTPSDFPGMF